MPVYSPPSLLTDAKSCEFSFCEPFRAYSSDISVEISRPANLGGLGVPDACLIFCGEAPFDVFDKRETFEWFLGAWPLLHVCVCVCVYVCICMYAVHVHMNVCT
jgi:hypothetical protein